MPHCCPSASIVYARRFLADGTAHVCAQCAKCGALVRLPEHKNRPYLKLEEVPAQETILPWNTARQGGA